MSKVTQPASVKGVWDPGLPLPCPPQGLAPSGKWQAGQRAEGLVALPDPPAVRSL